jgi:2-methylcitrate dehydratase
MMNGQRSDGIRQLVRYGLGVRADALPPEVVDALKISLLDSVACALGAAGAEIEHAATAATEGLLPDTARTATIWTSGAGVPWVSAAFVNGATLRYLDFMDIYDGKAELCHPSENIPLAIAICESRHYSGAQLIEFLAAAYEVQIALSDRFAWAAHDMHHASASSIVTALLVGKADSSPVAAVERAVSIAAARFPVLSAVVKGELSEVKAFNYPLGVIGGLWSAALGAEGIGGPADVIDWLASPDGDFADLGGDPAYRSDHVSLKAFPAQVGLQAVIEAALAVGPQLGLNAEIAEVTVHVPERVATRTADPAKYAPTNRETADHSLPFCAAYALLRGRFDIGAFESGAWDDEDCRLLMPRIRVVGDWESRSGASVTVELARGGGAVTATIDIPLGDHRRRMCFDDVAAKLATLAPGLPVSRRDGIVAGVRGLESLPDVADLVQLWSGVEG